MAETARLKLPLISASQAQKHVTHNEAIASLDLLSGVVLALARTLTAPVGTEVDGDAQILGAAGTGAWAGFSANDLALKIDGSWRRVLPVEGMLASIKAEDGAFVRYDGTAWRLAVQMISVLAADRAGADVATAQAVFGAGEDALSLAANTSYEFEAVYVLARTAGATSHTTAVLFGGTATFTSIDYLAKASNPTGNVLGAVSEIQGLAATAVVVTAASISLTENVRIHLKGIIRTNGAGTLIPQFQFSAAPGGAPTIRRNSFFSCRPLGNDTMVSAGAWA